MSLFIAHHVNSIWLFIVATDAIRALHCINIRQGDIYKSLTKDPLMTNAATEKDSKVIAIEAFFAAYATHDSEGIAKVLAIDIAWTFTGRHPLSGT